MIEYLISSGIANYFIRILNKFAIVDFSFCLKDTLKWPYWSVYCHGSSKHSIHDKGWYPLICHVSHNVSNDLIVYDSMNDGFTSFIKS